MLRTAMHQACRLQHSRSMTSAARSLWTTGILSMAIPSYGLRHLAPGLQHATSAAHQLPLLSNSRDFSPDRQPLRRSVCQASGSADDVSEGFKLIIYSRDDCSLCEGLKEKVQAVLDRAQFTGSPLAAATLEVRDISSNPEWQALYGLKIPVLASADADDSHEQSIPRPPPRLTADRLEKHIMSALEARSASG